MRQQHRALLRIVSVLTSSRVVQANGKRVLQPAPVTASAGNAQSVVQSSTPTFPQRHTAMQCAATPRYVPRAAIRHARLANARTAFALHARRAVRRRTLVSRSRASIVLQVNTSANLARRRVSLAVQANFRAVLGKRGVFAVAGVATRSLLPRYVVRTASQGSIRALLAKLRALLADLCEAERALLARI